MKTEQRVYITYRLERASGTRTEARALLGMGHLRGAVNRIYYACFYAVSALLLCEGRSSSKHTGLRALFNCEWVKTGRVGPDMGAFYNALFDNRQEADYEDLATFDLAEVQVWFDTAVAFVAEITKRVERQLSEDAEPPPQ